VTLAMGDGCERCTALAQTDLACICSYECTVCAVCAGDMKFVSPNCGGELVSRPRHFS
jgi:hypothetical protein